MASNQRDRAKANNETRDRRPYAIARYIRISSSKVRIVLDLIRGKNYDEAVVILSNTNKSACLPVLKVLNSAAANAENNLNMPKDTLFVAECFAMTGPIMKRMMPRAKGRGDRILKRTSHIKVVLDERKEKEQPTKKKAEPVKKVAAKVETAKKIEPKTTAKKTEVKGADVKKATAKPKAKEIPTTVAEKPLAKQPNAKKPLGTKKETGETKKKEEK